MHKKCEVVGLGALGVDYVATVSHFANNDTKVVADNVALFDGGVTANNLVQCARLGMKVKWCGAVGKDDLGMRATGNLQKDTIEISAVRQAQTQFCWIAADGTGERQIYLFPNSTRSLTPAIVEKYFRKDIERCLHFHTEIAVIPLGAAIAGVNIARQAGARVFLDVDGDVRVLIEKDNIGTLAQARELIRKAQVIKLTRLALKSITGSAEITQGMRKLLQTADLVAVTAGDKGCYIGNKKEIIHCPGYSVRCVDGTGAGDAFMGGLSYALWKNMPLREIGMFANACGAYACTQVGARGSGNISQIVKLQDTF